MHPENNLKSINTKFSLIQCSFMMSFCVIVGFSVILLQERNFSSSEIGIILAVECIFSVVSQMFLGGFADKHTNIPLKNILLVVLILSFIINIFLMFIPSNFYITIFIFILIGMTEYSVTGLINSLAIQFVNAGVPINFGLARGLGSLSYAVAGYFLGKVIATKGAESMLPIHAVFLIIVIIAVIIFQKPNINYNKEEKSHKIKETNIYTMIKHNNKLFYFLVAISLVFTSHAMISNFLPSIIEHVGGNSEDYGIAMALAALSEIPSMVFFSYFMKRIKSSKLIIISFMFFFIKSFLFIFSSNTTFILIFQMFNMLAYGLFVPASVYYVNEIVGKTEKIKGQSLVTIASMGIGITIGNFLGGVIIDRFGVFIMLVISAIIAFLGFIIIILNIKRKKTI